MTDIAWSYTSGTSDKPLLGLTIGDMFDRIVARYPDHEALVSRHQGLRYSYAQLQAEVDRCARGLIALGVASRPLYRTRDAFGTQRRAELYTYITS